MGPCSCSSLGQHLQLLFRAHLRSERGETREPELSEGLLQLQAQSREMLKGSRCCTSGLSFIAGASPRIMGVAAAGALGAWRAVTWIPGPGQAGKGPPGCPLPSHRGLSAAQSPSQLPSSQPILGSQAPSAQPCRPPRRAGIAIATQGAFLLLLFLLLVRPCHLYPPALPGACQGAFPPHSSMQNISSTVPCPCPAGLRLLRLQREGVRSCTASWTPNPGCYQGLFPGPHTSIWIFIQDGSEHPALHGRVAPHAPPPLPPPSRTDPTRIKRPGMSQNKYFTVNYQD